MVAWRVNPVSLAAKGIGNGGHRDALSSAIRKTDASIFSAFFPGKNQLERADVTETDRAYAQAFLMVGIDASAYLSNSALGELSAILPGGFKIKNAGKAIARSNITDFFKEATERDIRQGRVIKTIRTAISSRQSAVFTERVITGQYSNTVFLKK